MSRPSSDAGERGWDTERRCCQLLFQPGLTDSDRDWLRRQFEAAGLPTPDRDISWIQTTKIR